MNKSCPATQKASQIAPGGRYLAEDGTYRADPALALAGHIAAPDPHSQYRLDTDGLVFISRTVYQGGAGNYIVPAGATLLLVKGVGAGGGGGGAIAVPATVAACGGGAAGEYGELVIPSPIGPYAYVVGVGGLGGGAGLAGAVGGATTFDTLTLAGGGGGPGQVNLVADGAFLGGVAPVGVGGLWNGGTPSGGLGFVLGGGVFVMGGHGGHSHFGAGGDNLAGVPGANAFGPGGGGGGGSVVGPGGQPGGAGFAGLIIVEAYA